MTPEQIEIHRKDFEVLIIEVAKKFKYEFMDFVLKRAESGEYATTWVDAYWNGFLMSRDSLCVDLTKLEFPIHSMEMEEYHDGYHDCYDEIKSILQSAGINYRVE